MKTFFAYSNYYIDKILIFFYRITSYTFVDYCIGTFVLAFICVFIGEATISLALKFNKRYLDQLNFDMKEKQRLSMGAYKAGDLVGYKALNKEATDAWGKKFFTMVAYSAGILWPIPFALGWMQSRFQGVEFPILFPLSCIFGDSVGYTYTFIPLYILCRIIFKYLRPRLPYFRGIQKGLDAYETD
ncbi:MAG: hypothetical protein V2J25_11235 [Desulfatiglans sp.]|jgi:hypothetical protein|nr:hypothetical protein [Desulfatiglans sp.]